MYNGIATNASRYQLFARTYFTDTRMCVEEITVINAHASCNKTRNRSGCSCSLLRFFLSFISRIIVANAVNSIKGSSGKSVDSVELKLYSTDQGIEKTKT